MNSTRKCFKYSVEDFIQAIARYKIVLISFSVCFTIIFMYAVSHNNQMYIWDADLYWKLSDQFYPESGFTFLNFPVSYRGYFVPFCLFISKMIGGSIFSNINFGFILCNSIAIAFLISFIVPKLLHVKATRRYVGASIMMSAIIIYFWSDLLLYPLSDIYAIIFFYMGILSLEYLDKELNGNKSTMMIGIYSILFGMFSYAAYNSRTVYMVPVLIAVIYFIYRIKSIIKQKSKKVLFAVTMTIVGVIFVSLPQIAINLNTIDKFSIAVVTDSEKGVSLTLSQLYWGMNYPRYETNVEANVGNEITYPKPYVKFVDKEGNVLYNELIKEKKSYANLFKTYISEPFKVASMYMRHGVNGFMPIYRELYITDMNVNKWPAFFINCGILLTFIFGSIVSYKKFYKNGYILLCAFPAILALPGAIESRFTLPAFMLIYGIICYCVSYKKLVIYLKKKWIIALLFSSVCCIYSAYILTSTLSSTEENTPLYMDKVEVGVD